MTLLNLRSLLNPRFFALPLLTLGIIVSLAAFAASAP